MAIAIGSHTLGVANARVEQRVGEVTNETRAHSDDDQNHRRGFDGVEVAEDGRVIDVLPQTGICLLYTSRCV